MPDNFPKLAKRFRAVKAAESVAVEKATAIVHGEAVKLVQKGPASGSQRKDGSFASAPGEAPMSDTGNLARNIVTAFESKKEGLEGQVMSRASYSKALEFGTKKMEARPFMSPAYNKHKKAIKRMFREAGGGT